MRLRLFLVAAACTTAVLFPVSASAQPRMMIGFQDDPSLRWRDDRLAVFDLAQQANAGIVRTTVYWSRIAQTRPANGANPFDPAYRFDDLDEFVRNAGLHGMEVMLTIWGTPSWANGGKGQNYAPTSYSSLQNFAKALATRYSGRYTGYPFVRYFTVWNESNLGQFLSPQYDAKGKPAAPAIYAKLYRAAYAGIKAGNSRALVGIGETSARGRDRYLGRAGHAGDRVAGQVRRAAVAAAAGSQVRCLVAPPVSDLDQREAAREDPLAERDALEHAAVRGLARPVVQAEDRHLGHRVRHPDEAGAAEGRDVRAAGRRTCGRRCATSRGDPNVSMFIWFILRDDPTSAWKSGLVAARRHQEAVLRRLHRPRNPYRRTQPAVLRQSRHRPVRWSSSPRSSCGPAPAPAPRSA